MGDPISDHAQISDQGGLGSIPRRGDFFRAYVLFKSGNNIYMESKCSIKLHSRTTVAAFRTRFRTRFGISGSVFGGKSLVVTDLF